MKKLLLAICLCAGSSFSFAQQTMPATLRSVLLEELKTTHNQKDWFVPANTAVEDLTAAQAMWKDSSGNHSVAQLVNHLVFWNSQQLAKFKGEKPAAFSGNNEETFPNKLDKESWTMLVKKMDEVMIQLEKLVAAATDAQLQQWSGAIAHISTHNAYHIGQIIFVRKLQGSWNPEKGVK